MDLTQKERTGVEHSEDFLQHIPRAEVTKHGGIVRMALQKADHGFQAIFGGSHRRGNTGPDDIAILITKENASLAHILTIVLDTVVPRWMHAGF